MTRTEHYQFPLWEASDPLRREDFNRAWESIDGNLNGLWGALIPGAERDLLEFRAQVDAGETPSDGRILYNRLDTEEDAQPLSGAVWSGDKHIYIGAATRSTLDDLKANSGLSQIGYLKSTPQDYAAFYEFTAPDNAHFTAWSFLLTVFFTSSTASQMDLEFQMKAEKKEESAWSVIFETESIPVHAEGTSTVRLWTQVPVEFTTEEGAEYRMALRLAAGGTVSGAFGFTAIDSDSSLYTDDIQVEFTPPTKPAGSPTRELAAAGTCRALVLARYNADPDQGGVTALWDGAELDGTYRDTADRDGGACRELRALVKGPFPETSVLQLDLSCGEEDDLCLLDYCVLLL